MSQPPLSHQIRLLERELGVTLLYRDSHTVRLTPAGSTLLAEALKLLALADRLSGVVRSSDNQPAGLLRIGFIGPYASLFIGRVLRVVALRYPGLIPDLEELSSAQQRREVHEGTLDVGVVWETANSRRPDTDLDSMSVYEDSVCLAMAPNNPLAAASSVTFEQLARERLVLFRRRGNPEVHDAITNSLQSHGIWPSMLHSDGKAVVDMVAAGLGVTIATMEIVKRFQHEVVLRPFEEPLLTIRLALVWMRANALPALRGFIDVASEVKESSQPV